MKTFLMTAMAAAMLAGTAHAATITTTPGAPYPGVPSGQAMFLDFESPLPSGVSLTGNYTIFSTPSGTGQSAPPAGSALGNHYLSVPNPISSGSAVLDFSNYLASNNLKVTAFSFYWGSVDKYNTLQLLDTDGNVFQTINGGSFPPANGDQSAANTNLRFNFVLGDGETLGGLKFKSTNYAYEIDNIAWATTSAVPEPQSWLMMIMGFGAVGIALRRKTLAIA